MTISRSTLYWLWFVLFGVINTLARLVQHITLTSEDYWLLAIGFIGVFTIKALAQFARPFDFIVGMIFLIVGVIGILHNFSIDMVNRGTTPFLSDSVRFNSFLGLSLCLLPSLIHIVLGYISLNIGLKPASSTSQLLVKSSD